MKNLLSKLKNSLTAYHPEVINYDEFKHSAIFLPLITIDNECSLLFEKRAHHISQGGEICFPGGKVEKNEEDNPLITALRESSEELGLNINKISLISRLPRLITPDGKLIDAFIGSLNIRDISEITINQNEVDSIFTIPLTSLKTLKLSKYKLYSTNISGDSLNDSSILPVKKLGLPPKYEGDWGKKSYSIYVTYWQDEIIWGLTARYLKFIQDLL